MMMIGKIKNAIESETWGKIVHVIEKNCKT